MNAQLSSSAAPVYAEMLARARQLKPALLQRARAAESARTLPAETVEELQRSGLFELQKPARFGGLELGLVEFVEIVAELGRSCGSTAWVYGVTAERAWLVGKFGLDAQREVWDANPGALITSSITLNGAAAPAQGGWRVTGHWQFVSGIDIADWCVFCTNLPRGAGMPPEAAYFLIPKAQCEIVDTWHVAGLAATGSRDVRVDDVFVPAHRFVPVELLREGGGPGLEANPAPLFRLPLIAINPYAVLAPMLGIAEGALEQTLEGVKSRRLLKVAGTAAEQQVVQLRIAEAAAEIDAARALILADCREAMACVERGEPLPVALRVRVRRNHGFAAKLLMSAVDRLFTTAGGRGIYLDHYMQRAFRDIHAAGSHLGLSWDLLGTMWGQHALGLPLSSTAY
jgi:3-hydroxy-9,10-secoandrosta-1,3,5(10)-triene-9,17-dione monooxygenase